MPYFRLDEAVPVVMTLVMAALPVVVATAQGRDEAADRARLLALNLDYIRAVQAGDVARFQAILADDFRASMPDGSLLDKAAFLAQTGKPVTISRLECHDVELRLLGDIAIVHARTTYVTADGRAAAGRYTDVWARRGETWLAVSAHVTRN
jgi:ketosteroid isomerase-like protein